MALPELKRNGVPVKTPEFIQQVADHAAQVIASRADIDDVQAIELGQAVAARLAHVFGGSRIWIAGGVRNTSSNFCFDLSRRDLDLYRAFDGHNHSELAARYGVTTRYVYTIIERVRRSMRATTSRAAPKPTDTLCLTTCRDSL